LVFYNGVYLDIGIWNFINRGPSNSVIESSADSL
jgi:hypothetical protein